MAKRLRNYGGNTSSGGRKANIEETFVDEKPNINVFNVEEGYPFSNHKVLQHQFVPVYYQVDDDETISGGTSSLSSYLLAKHKDICREQRGSVEGIQTIIDRHTRKTFSYIKEKDHIEMAKMTAYDALPLSFPWGPDFVTYIQRNYNPMFEGILRNTCRADIIDLYKKYRFYLRHVLNSLNCSVSLTVDIGITLNKLEFLAITCHWIDDSWVMQKRVITYLYDEGKHHHDIQFLVNEITTTMHFFNIYEKTLSIALDNASNNTKVIGLIKKELNPPLENIFHVRCSCHSLNLIVKECLYLFADPIQKVKNAVVFLFCNGNKAKMRDFKIQCKQVGLRPVKIQVEVDTRWTYTYLMLRQAYEYRVPIQNTHNMHNEKVTEWLNNSDWADVKECLELLEHFYNATFVFSRQFYPAVTGILAYLTQIARVLYDHREKPGYQAAIFSMREKFKKYYFPIPTLFILGSLLNPCLKTCYTIALIRQMYEYLEITTEMPSLSDAERSVDFEIKKAFAHFQNLVESTITPRTPRPTTSTSQPKKKFFSNLPCVIKSKSTVSTSAKFNELHFYLTQTVVEMNDDEVDVLAWWKKYEACYPILARMAQDILNVQISTMTSESAFIQGGQQIGDHRYSLSGFNLQVLVCIRDWIRSERRNQRLATVEGEEEEIELLIASEADQIDDIEDLPMDKYNIEEITEMIHKF